MNNVMTIGLDLSKNIFALVALSPTGKEVWRKTLRRKQVLRWLARQEKAVVAMELCGGAYYWGRQIHKLGHDIELLPAQFVKAYQRGQKNDYNDALAIAEASRHGRIRSAALKTVEQQDEQSFHRIRQGLSQDRVRLSNQLRGLLAEYGVVIPKGKTALRQAIPLVLEDAENELTARFRLLVQRQYKRLLELDEELDWYEKQLKVQAREDEVCCRLMEVPSIGPVVAGALKSWMGDGKQFQRGRDASAALGLVPKQHSSGGKQVLLGITKRGDSYLRSLLVHGARSVVARADHKTDPLSLWIQRIKATRGYNKAAVALANKMVRVAWAIIVRGEEYRPSAS